MVYKWAKQFINWPKILQAGRTVYKLLPRTNGRSCNYFNSYVWQLTKHREGLCLSTSIIWQSSLTCEPHRLYYNCRLRETFRRDTAEMATCWLHLVASAIDQWLLTALKDLGAIIIQAVQCTCRLAFWRPRRLIDPLSNRAGWLIDPLSDSARPRPVLNQADRFIIQLNG